MRFSRALLLTRKPAPFQVHEDVDGDGIMDVIHEDVDGDGIADLVR